MVKPLGCIGEYYEIIRDRKLKPLCYQCLSWRSLNHDRGPSDAHARVPGICGFDMHKIGFFAATSCNYKSKSHSAIGHDL